MQHPQHDEIVLTLENDGAFYRTYGQAGLPGTARNEIRKAVSRLLRHQPKLVDTFNTAHAEEVREYLDERWDIVRPKDKGLSGGPRATRQPGSSVSDWIEQQIGKPYATGGIVRVKPEVVFGSNPRGTSWVDHDFVKAEKRVVTNYLVQGVNANAFADSSFDQFVKKMFRSQLLFGTPDGVTAVGDHFDNQQEYENHMSLRHPLTNTNTAKETTMLKITTPVLVNGIDITTLSSAELYNIISAQEDQITKLDAIKNKPARLVTEIAELQAGIDALVAAMNAKDGVVPVPAAATTPEA